MRRVIRQPATEIENSSGEVKAEKQTDEINTDRSRGRPVPAGHPPTDIDCAGYRFRERVCQENLQQILLTGRLDLERTTAVEAFRQILPESERAIKHREPSHGADRDRGYFRKWSRLLEEAAHQGNEGAFTHGTAGIPDDAQQVHANHGPDDEDDGGKPDEGHHSAAPFGIGDCNLPRAAG